VSNPEDGCTKFLLNFGTMSRKLHGVTSQRRLIKPTVQIAFKKFNYELESV